MGFWKHKLIWIPFKRFRSEIAKFSVKAERIKLLKKEKYIPTFYGMIKSSVNWQVGNFFLG